jgi:hypothetical protein
MDRKNSTNGRALTLLIDGHSESVRRRTVTCEATVCCHCGQDVTSNQIAFAFHGTRARRFLVLVGSYVCKVAALLARWRCPHCRRTFTDYPPFACPHKAYTLPQMTEHAAKYVSNTSTSYRKGVCWANLPIFHENGPMEGAGPSRRANIASSPATMAHTSLFRWVTSLGRHARQPESLSTDFAPASRKYTSQERRDVLIACRATCSVLLLDRSPAAPLG